MPDILESALNSRVALSGILVRHPNDQAANLGEDTVPARALVRVRPLPHDELPMPPQDCVRCDDARDLTQYPPTQPMPSDRQPASIVIGELEPLSTQLASKDPIFFHQIRDRLAFLAIHPTSQDGQHHVESGRVDHGRSLYQGRKSYRCPSIQSWDITATRTPRLG
jgi:hypothetical protein